MIGKQDTDTKPPAAQSNTGHSANGFNARALLKRLRSSQPFNRFATETTRAFCRTLGVRPEWIIKHLHRVGQVRAELPNGRTMYLQSNGDDWVSNQVFWRGWNGYEPESVNPFFRFASQSMLTLDVGAYVGYYSLLAGHANPAGQVFAFEPLPPIFERLQTHVSVNRLSNVHCIPSAVGELSGEEDFFHTATELPTSSSLSLEFMSSAPDLRRSKVPVVSLDQFVEQRELKNVDLVKIDTESTEPQVLMGMKGILCRDRPTLFCEVLPGRNTEARLESILGPLGYRYFQLTPNGPTRRDRIEGHSQWLNYLFIARDNGWIK